MISDRDWSSGGLAEEYSNTDALLVRKSALSRGFSGEGRLVASVEFSVIGDLSACMRFSGSCPPVGHDRVKPDYVTHSLSNRIADILNPVEEPVGAHSHLFATWAT